MTFSVSSKLGKLVALRTLPRKIPLFLKIIEVKTLSFEKSATRTIKIRFLHSSRELLVDSVPLETYSIQNEIESISPVTESADTVESVTRSKNIIETLSSIPLSELTYPMKELSNIPNETMRVLDEFSSLPMWFTMPIVFVSSIILGAVVALLI